MFRDQPKKESDEDQTPEHRPDCRWRACRRHGRGLHPEAGAGCTRPRPACSPPSRHLPGGRRRAGGGVDDHRRTCARADDRRQRPGTQLPRHRPAVRPGRGRHHRGRHAEARRPGTGRRPRPAAGHGGRPLLPVLQGHSRLRPGRRGGGQPQQPFRGQGSGFIISARRPDPDQRARRARCQGRDRQAQRPQRVLGQGAGHATR